MLKFSAWLACVTGVILAIAALLLKGRNFDTDLYYIRISTEFVLIALISGVLLIGAGLAALLRKRWGPIALACAWGFTLAMSLVVLAPFDWYVFAVLEDHKASTFLKNHLLATGFLTATAVTGLALVIANSLRSKARP